MMKHPNSCASTDRSGSYPCDCGIETYLWHQYAAAALAGMTAGQSGHSVDCVREGRVSVASDYADAMIEEARKRGRV